ncbi:MAG: ORF6N domain-containing protein [Burkholderiales bacterium]|jgi:hypothetical protein|nr:ORF6N domain-containing protein [Burkholderiales bacterium]
MEIPLEAVTSRIVLLRGQRVMLDADLATLYGVSTKRFNEQVKRNRDRFPPDFMFQIAEDELVILRSHFATSENHGHVLTDEKVTKSSARPGHRNVV